MSDSTTSWFHCGKCGALFRAEMGNVDGRVCDTCGETPSIGIATPEVHAPQRRRSSSADADESDEDNHGSRGHRRRRKKSGVSVLALFAGWTVVMFGIVLVANRCWKPGGSQNVVRQIAVDDVGGRMTEAEYEFLRIHAESCQEVLSHVATNSAPELLTPYVFGRVGTLPDMVRFSEWNAGLQLVGVSIDTDGMSVLRLPDRLAIEGRWKVSDGRTLDVVFRQDQENWLVDWHHYVRYSEYPWALFLAGDGPAEAEFRLLVRQRFARETVDLSRPLSIVFAEPRFGRPGETGPESQPFDLDRSSDVARLLSAGFAQMREGSLPFRSLLPRLEPGEDWMRVRVRIRRNEADAGGERTFEIVRVLACHWLQLDDPGVRVDESE